MGRSCLRLPELLFICEMLQVFKLLVEIGDYGLSVKQCMELRCVSRWARDQIVRTQLALRMYFVSFLREPCILLYKTVLSDNSSSLVNCAHLKLPELVQCVREHELGYTIVEPVVHDCHCVESKNHFLELVETDGALFQLVWNSIGTFCDDVCKVCIMKGREYNDTWCVANIMRLENYPLMCLQCWREESSIEVLTVNDEDYEFKSSIIMLESKNQNIPVTTSVHGSYPVYIYPKKALDILGLNDDDKWIKKKSKY